jgi:superfamily II DNA/RNA helicase
MTRKGARVFGAECTCVCVDVCAAQSVTGSGKTLAYALPLLSRLDAGAAATALKAAVKAATEAAGGAEASKTALAAAALPPAAPQALIVTPTRELAVQVCAVVAALAAGGGAKRKAAPLRVERLVGLPTEGMTVNTPAREKHTHTEAHRRNVALH